MAVQNAACSLQGLRIERDRFGPDFRRRLREAETRQAWSAEQMVAHRDSRLHAFVQHAAATVPYYRRLFRDAGIDAGSIRSLQDLGQLPILTKQIVQDRPDDFLSETVSRQDLVPAHTSGTTGGGLVFRTTRAAVREQFAVWWRYFRRHGLERRTWCAYFGGRSIVPLGQLLAPFWRMNRPGRQILFSGYHLSPATAAHYVAELRARQPPWIHGYPSLIALLASYVLEQRTDLGYTPRWITTGAENLMPHQADTIAKAFGTRPVQHYGMAEAVANISQCPRGGLHLDEDFAAVEFVPNPGGQGHRIIGTNFTNTATPLLRYEVGDLAEPRREPCPCGLPGRLVASIDGRLEDYVVLRNGARLGRMDHIFKDAVNVREAQIVQGAPGKITVRLVRREGFGSEDADRLQREFRKRVGELAEVRFDYVESLPRSPNGKLRFVVSEPA